MATIKISQKVVPLTGHGVRGPACPPSTRQRAMQTGSSKRTSGNMIELSDSQAEFYAKLLFYSTLEPYRGQHTDRESAEASADPILQSQKKLRRAFLDKVAYLCDVEKYGRTTTATALQTLKFSKILWVAANEGVRESVFAFLRWLIGLLRDVSHESRQEMEGLILQRAVPLAIKRIQFYRERMLEFAGRCCIALKPVAQQNEDVSELRKWLSKLRYIPESSHLAFECFNERGRRIRQLRQYSKAKNDDFDELCHYLGRLGAHVYAVKTIVAAALKVPSIKRISDVREENCSEEMVAVVPVETLDPYEIVKKIALNRPTEAPSYLYAFFQLDLDLKNGSFKTKLRESGGRIKTRVHCELLLLDRFSRQKFDFVGNDKYVGCSKGACYYCFKYISMHHNDLVVPATHNKVLTHVRGPSADPQRDVNGNGERLLKQMEDKMNWCIDQDILTALIETERKGSQFQHCSTDGSSLAPSVVM